MTATNEEKANEFLEYVSQNMELLKNNLKKNITYNEDIFDDSFNETILKIYESILKNGTNIKDYKHYFYISSKWNYILNQDRYERDLKRNIRNYFISHDKNNENEIEKEEIKENIKSILKALKEILYENFSKEDIDLFFVMYENKINGKYTLQMLQEDSGLSLNDVTNRMRNIKDFINTNEEIKDLKKLI